MKKNFLQDVIPASQKRSIRDIPLPMHKEHAVTQKRAARPRRDSEEDYTETYEKPIKINSEHTPSFEKEEKNASESRHSYQDSTPETDLPSKSPTHSLNYKKTKNSFMKKILIGIACGILIFLGFMVSKTKATITIHPKTTTQNINIVIPIDSNNKLATQTQITKTVSKTIPATSEQQVEKQASGRIKIINTHKETPQELVKNTRFQTPNGLIYRIKDSIVVPGYTMSGSTIVPGTLEVEVFADSAGEEYNVSNVKFTIPGFSGKEQFTKITAESVGEISGGYIGVRKVVSEEAKVQTKKDLETELGSQIKQTQNQSTEYIIVPEPETLAYGELQDKAEGDSVVLILSATVNAYSFVKKDLFNFIGQNSIQGAVSTDTFTLDSENLTFSADKTSIKITGSTLITWLTDTQKLQKDFSNKKRSEIATMLDTYHSFEKADAKLSPFWKTRFPSDPSKIEVIISE